MTYRCGWKLVFYQMELDSEKLLEAARAYIVFAFEFGDPSDKELEQARDRFNQIANELYRDFQQQLGIEAFRRPDSGQFRASLMEKCRKIYRERPSDDPAE